MTNKTEILDDKFCSVLVLLRGEVRGGGSNEYCLTLVRTVQMKSDFVRTSFHCRHSPQPCQAFETKIFVICFKK